MRCLAKFHQDDVHSFMVIGQVYFSFVRALQHITGVKLNALSGYVVHFNCCNGLFAIGAHGKQAIIEFGFTKLGLHTIEAKVSPQNRSAIYLMEQLGFVKEAHFKDRIYFEGEFQDMAVYMCYANV
jgi:hypothetical protein